MKTIFRGLITLITLLLCWEGIVVFFKLPSYILPPPSQVLLTLFTQSAIIGKEASITLLEMLTGFLLGVLLGCTAGLAITLFKPLKQWCLPILIISQAIPTFAIAPLLVIWLGFGLASKIATTVLMLFFPITSAFYDGLQNTPPGFLDLAKTMNATKWRLFYTIRIPAALPSLASGIRIAAVIAPIGAVVGEWVGSSRGLGYLMLNANARLQIDMMFAALIVMIALALALYFTVDKLLRVLIWW